MNTKEQLDYYFENYFVRTSSDFCEHRPLVICKDGFSVSIQASQYHYSHPRITSKGPFNAFELGFPSDAEPLLDPYQESDEDPTTCVYGYVPVEIVVAILEKHGGFFNNPKDILELSFKLSEQDLRSTLLRFYRKLWFIPLNIRYSKFVSKKMSEIKETDYQKFRKIDDIVFEKLLGVRKSSRMRMNLGHKLSKIGRDYIKQIVQDEKE